MPVTTPNIKELRQEYARRNRRRPWWLRALVGLAGLAALLVAAVYLAGPSLVRGRLEKQLAETLRRPVKIERVALDPLRLAASIHGLAIAETSGAPFVTWKRLHANLSARSLTSGEWRFDEIVLDGFDARIDVAKDGRLNLADLLALSAGKPKEAPAAAPRALQIDRFVVTEARIAYVDASRSEPFATQAGPIAFTLRQFHTGGANQAPGEFSAETESGETIAWRGLLAVAPLRSSGEISFGKIPLKKYQPEFGDRVRFRVLDGVADVKARYELVVVKGKLALRVAEGVAKLRGFKLADKNEPAPVIALEAVDFSGIALDTDKRTFAFDRVGVTGGALAVRRDASGLQLLNLLTPAGPAPRVGVPPRGAPEEAPFEARVAELTVQGVSLAFEDRTTPSPVRQQFDDVAVKVRGFSSSQPSVGVAFEVGVRTAGGGALNASGNLALRPLKGVVSAEVSRFPLAGFGPYLEGAVAVKILRGTLSAAGKGLIDGAGGGAPVIYAQGDAAVTDFAAAAGSGDPIASWRDLRLRGADFTSGPQMKLVLAEVEWSEPSATAVLLADGSSNFAGLRRSGNAGTAGGGVRFPAPGEKPAPAPAAGFVAIDRFIVSNGAVSLADESVRPRVVTALEKLSGTVTGLSSAGLARADVDLKGTLNGAPVVMSGQINPLAAETFSDVKLTAKAADLLPFSPYVAKYAGYELERGNVSLEVRLRIMQRRLDASNVVVLDDFTLGATTESPDATSLPVPLALALLRDSQGKIVIDLPVQGNLTDPNFRIGRVVGRVLTQLVAKAATSPFTLIGSMFGGSAKGEELSFQDFDPGVSTLDTAAIRKLDVMAKALRERPALKLDVRGGVSEPGDAPALRERELETRIRTALKEEMRRVAPSSGAAAALADEEIRVTPEGEARMLGLFYREAFSPEPALAAPAEAKTAATPPKRRWFIFRLFTRSTPAAKTAQAPVAPALAAGPAPEAAQPLPPVRVMRAQLLEAIPIDASELRALAAERARAAQRYLLEQGGVPAERVTVSEQIESAPRVRLAIK